MSGSSQHVEVAVFLEALGGRITSYAQAMSTG